MHTQNLSLNPSFFASRMQNKKFKLHNTSNKKIESEEGMAMSLSFSKGLSLRTWTIEVRVGMQALKINVKRAYMKSWLLGRHAGASAVYLSCSLFLLFLMINNWSHSGKRKMIILNAHVTFSLSCVDHTKTRWTRLGLGTRSETSAHKEGGWGESVWGSTDPAKTLPNRNCMCGFRSVCVCTWSTT